MNCTIVFDSSIPENANSVESALWKLLRIVFFSKAGAEDNSYLYGCARPKFIAYKVGNTIMERYKYDKFGTSEPTGGWYIPAGANWHDRPRPFNIHRQWFEFKHTDFLAVMDLDVRVTLANNPSAISRLSKTVDIQMVKFEFVGCEEALNTEAIVAALSHV